ncbi:DUF3006 domain-containing protein [Halorussus litoreus]|uniref:DUF3006 domain-containing protein n=1 Tax=Halorussus litoreus TaxID=1710536 RepID=UPI000E249B88|nr:DUF3006 domain-containing protein [Halorussus litoreus]
MTGDREQGRGVPDGRYTAVVDRFEPTEGDRELAVLLLEADGASERDEEVVAERAIPKWRLPEAARKQDAVLTVALRNGFVVSTSYEADATERRTSAAQDRFDGLAERPGEDSDGSIDGSGDQ